MKKVLRGNANTARCV